MATTNRTKSDTLKYIQGAHEAIPYTTISMICTITPPLFSNCFPRQREESKHRTACACGNISTSRSLNRHIFATFSSGAPSPYCCFGRKPALKYRTSQGVGWIVLSHHTALIHGIILSVPRGAVCENTVRVALRINAPTGREDRNWTNHSLGFC